MAKKTRKRPIYNTIRQQRWLIWRLISEHRCCFCNELLFEGYDPKKINVTIHHVAGAIETDDYTRPSPVEDQLFAHCSCHKAYSQMERLKEKGCNIDRKRFAFFERNVQKAIKRVKRNLR